MSGLPGCGKTHFVRAVVETSGLPVFHVTSVQLVQPVTGAGERYLVQVLDAVAQAAPCFLVLDDMESLTPDQPVSIFQVRVLSLLDDDAAAAVQEVLLGLAIDRDHP